MPRAPHRRITPAAGPGTDNETIGDVMSNLINHAKRELQAIGYKMDGTNEPYNQAAVDAILELVDTFAKQGHSGFSGNYVLKAFGKLADFEPLTPLTGEDSEWNECGDGVWQNNRCSHVFKQADRFDGQAYDINGRVFREPSGSCYTGKDSMVPVTFPYTPTTVYVDAPGEPA
jgi:hypothetical protein